MDVVDASHIRLAPYLDAEVMPHYRKVTARPGADQGWAEQEMTFRKSIDTLELRQVNLSVTARWLPPLTFHTCCVVAEKPLFVSWITVESLRVIEALFAWGWRGWSLQVGGGIFDPRALLLRAPLSGGLPVTFSRVSRSPLFAGRAIFKALSEQVAPRSADVDVDYRLHWRGQQELDSICEFLREVEEARDELSREGFHGFKNPVKGHCSVCGRPLRDAQSLRLGIGPDCLSRVGWVADYPALRDTDTPTRLWASGEPVEKWRARLLIGASKGGVTDCPAEDVAREVARRRLMLQRRPRE